jgi:hypothetical protein
VVNTSRMFVIPHHTTPHHTNDISMVSVRRVVHSTSHMATVEIQKLYVDKIFSYKYTMISS